MSNDPATDRKVQILQAATAVLRDDGLAALSFETVAHRAGLSRQLVRYYYSDLEALMIELCDRLGAAYRDILVNGIVQIGDVNRLSFFVDFFFDLSGQHPMPDNLEAYDALVGYAVSSAPFRDRLCAQYHTLGQVIVHELAIAHPELDGHSCEELSFIFVSMMHAHWSFVASLGYSREHSKLARRAIYRLIDSYVAEDAPKPTIERPWAQDHRFSN